MSNGQPSMEIRPMHAAIRENESPASNSGAKNVSLLTLPPKSCQADAAAAGLGFITLMTLKAKNLNIWMGEVGR